MSQSSPHPLLAQSRHISVIGLSGDEPEFERYIVIWDSHELTRPMLMPPQSHARKIRHAPHHIEYYRAAMLVKLHGHEV